MKTLTNYTFEELEIGSSATFERTLEERDLVLFAAVSGDVNPLHLDPEFASTTQFGERIAHGAWSGSLISAALANVMPGPGTVYLGQNLKFQRPVKLGDRLTVQLEVKEKKERRHQVTFITQVVNQDGKTVVSGEAQVMAPTEKMTLEAPVLPAISIG
ncbi:MaoC family dehydratase N-terminal domain-containing protein [Aestuariirhabdus sp. Z084]|uniref:MaoC/PaaZ C-terminal domain-containing protein n=1 Tax=Aestuariirhabdus haliotis TaxID=2918751 RepID=UPI00201B36C7|nr:MaoC/PaaZ C-terminal domain-containing protein [Aestuariirhabdus haliotis]MCL6414629.1 MaoC family dehydratase N-terminal domain-containing protein [Aestuariirhabdus haliotis]MCL6418389.1 MaoC family dehydratase N-terminal domain-containing protein [Aestuariirhabdus haliotis]